MDQSHNATKQLILVAIFSACLAVVKFVAFAFTGSLLVLTSSLDSLGDTVISFVNAKISKTSLTQADKEHPFGHGGIEVIASLIQGIIIFSLSLSVMIETLLRIYRGQTQSEVSIESFPLAIAVMVFSTVASFICDRLLTHSKKKLEENNQRSLAISADHAHYHGDAMAGVFTSAGLIVIYFSDFYILDSIFGFLGACALMYAAVPVLRQVFRDILHAEATAETQQQIVDIVYGTSKEIVSVHRLRTRTLGPTLFIDFHMKISGQKVLDEAHELGEQVTSRIKATFPNCDVIFHLDPESEPDDDLWEPSYKAP